MEELFDFDKPKIICGTDEAGRGPLAGPVTAAAVVLPAIYTAVEGSIDKAALFTTAKEVLDIVDGSKDVQSIEESTEEIAEAVSGEEE